MPQAPFPERERVDAHDKVLGKTAYAADVHLPGLLYAMTVPATIAKGQVVDVPVEPAMRVPGVLRVLTAADFAPPPQPAGGGGESAGAPPPTATITPEIAYRGQPVALVVAETLEAAIEGAEALRPTYAQAPFMAVIDSPGTTRDPFRPTKAGDAAKAMPAAATTVEAQYVGPAQHHNPIEMLSTTADWRDGKLTIHEGTQGAQTLRASIARSLRIDPAIIEVKSPYVGGAFGQKGSIQRQSAIVARAAMLIGRPVKLVMPRGQIFHNATFRPRSRHRITLGADAAGKLVAIRYDADHQQSRKGGFPPAYHETPPMMYGVPNYDGTSAHVRIDTQDPGFMRAPNPHPAHFAFESAVDELAYKLGRDPVAFRLAHQATVNPLSGKPFSSAFLNDCLTQGARRFGWDRRTMAPRSMILPDGTTIGWGVAGGCYPAPTTPTIATLRITADGRTVFAVGGHEMGQGIRTVIVQLLQRELGVGPERLEIEIGDTAAAPQHLTAGSWGTVSVIPAVIKASAQIKAQLAELSGGRAPTGTVHQQLARTRRPFLQAEVSNVAPGQDAKALDKLRSGEFARGGPDYPDFASFSYIAHFVEVRVEPTTRRVRVPRVVSVADGGRIVSPRTAASQVRGGVVMAIGSALREETEVDPRYGGWLNADIADYVMPVNADIGDIDVSFVDRPDPLLNAVGAKSVGEVSMVGAAAAVANAVYHATGTRIRKMPIRIEDLI
ncbi:xanthine dehydrogenase family protein molybdopterin-binding subunit [Sphingomonas bacterium]|uniref:xanthine dehydrogenase family protein molybdopterin-binding subunit n=1 Tax=Sphingomonas bacterium TaxID=1895847 RepID=UPI0015764B60|nr:xanthine dehydrogenase family protein molybdopterin-binding subunit [Sphingomonas bacterium]